MSEQVDGVVDAMTQEHPSVIAMRAETAAAIQQGYSKGDVNHYTQPVIGILRLRQHLGEAVTDRDIAWAVGSLTKACRAEVALLANLGTTNPPPPEASAGVGEGVGS